jgi:hypothetical protein
MASVIDWLRPVFHLQLFNCPSKQAATLIKADGQPSPRFI